MSKKESFWNRPIQRRQMMKTSIKAIAALSLGACSSPPKPVGPLNWPSSKPSPTCDKPFQIDYKTSRDPAFQSLVEKIIDTPEDRTFEVVTEILKKESGDTLLGALLCADVRAIVPFSGGDLHAALAIHASRTLHHSLPEEFRWIPLYYSANGLKFRQERQPQDKLIGKAPPLKTMSPEKAQKEFDASMKSWDVGAADEGIVNLFENVPTEKAVEQLIRWGPRNMGDIGHAVIWFALGIRSLDTLGWHFAQPVLRSIVHDCLTKTKRTTKMYSLYEPHRDELLTLKPQLDECKIDDGIAVELLAELRRGDSTTVSKMVKNLFKAKVPTRSIWDGLALSGSEHLLRGGAGFSLHRFDGMNALHHLYRRTNDPDTKALILLQASVWMAKWNNDVYPSCCRVDDKDIQVDKLEPKPVERLDEIFDTVKDGPMEAGSRVMGWVQGGGSKVELIRRAQILTIQKANGNDEHNYKFPVAVFEQTELATDKWKPHILAAIGSGFTRSPATHRGDWTHLRSVRDWISKLGK